MIRLKFIPKSLIMFTLLMGSFLTIKSAQAWQVREASVNNSLPRNVLNYNGSPACFVYDRPYTPPVNCPSGMTCGPFSVPNRKVFLGKVHSGYCYYVNGRVKRANNYNVFTYQDYQSDKVVWVRVPSDVREHQSRIGNRQWKPLMLIRGQGICGLNYRNEYHIGRLGEINGQYVCQIPYGENAVNFSFGQFYIAGYFE